MANDHNDCAEGRGITFAPDNRFDTSVMPRFDQVGLGASSARLGLCLSRMVTWIAMPQVWRDPRSGALSQRLGSESKAMPNTGWTLLIRLR
jgi:hypothetical protein